METVRWEKLEDPSRSPKRTKHSSIACTQCRRLKVRCQGGSPASRVTGAAPKACHYCKQHAKKCDWPFEDGRRLKRPRSRSLSQSSNGSGPDPIAGLSIDEIGGPTSFSTLDEGKDESALLPKTSGPPALVHEKSAESALSDGRHSSAGETPFKTVRYHRHHGPTALVPGHKQVSLKARYESNEDHQTHQSLPLQGLKSSNQTTVSRSRPSLFDGALGLPSQSILPDLLEAFFKNYGDLYCFINREHLSQLIAGDKPPVFLVSVIAALSARFCDPSLFNGYFPPVTEGMKREPWEYCTPFLEHAKSMVVSTINLPSTDGIAGLLLLSFADFGDNNEAGLWMYTGMAIRMIQEIGLQRRRSERRPSYQVTPQELTAPRGQLEMVDSDAYQEAADVILFWCVFAHDVALCNGTGRVPNIKAHEINVRFPTNLDVARARSGPGRPLQPLRTEVYPELSRIMLLLAESIDFLNTEASQIAHPAHQRQAADRFSRIENLKNKLMHTYRSLPKEISAGAIYYQKAVDHDQAGPYMFLHLQYHLQIAFLSQESLVEMSDPLGTGPQTEDLEALRVTNNELFKSSIKAVTDLLTIAKLIDDHPCDSIVYLNQAFFHAACAFCRDMVEITDDHQSKDGKTPPAFPLGTKTSPSMVFPTGSSKTMRSKASTSARSSTHSFLALNARANYQFLRQAIKDQAELYAGSSWVDAVLAQRERGLRDVDLSIVSDDISTFIRLHNLREEGSSQAVLQQFVPPQPQNDDASSGIPELSNVDWSNFSADLFANAELNFDPQAFFSDYMLSEQNSIGFA